MNKKYEDLGLFLAFGLMVVLLVGAGVCGGHLLSYSKIESLGNSICEEEYNMTFEEYKDGKLSCKPFEIEQQYDGIKVRITDGG